MTDFISELEAELVAAARRRAAAPKRRRPRVSLPRLRPAPVAAAAVVAAIAAAAVLVVANIGETGPGDERAVPPASTGAALILPAALPVAACDERDQRVATGGVPDVPLSVFEREHERADALPELEGEWLPATTIRPGESRRVGLIYLVPADGIREDGACVPPDEHDGGSGVCLVVGEPVRGGTGVPSEPVVRCFDDATIAAGRAVALTAPGRVHGIAPDGVQHLKLEWTGGAFEADVHDNVYTARTPGLQAGDAVRVVVQRPARGCVPSGELLRRFPVLGGPAADPPAALAQAMESYGARAAWRRWAQLAVADEDLELWVAANLPCDNDRRPVEEACIVPIGDGVEPRPLCVRPDAAASWMVIPGADGAVFAGLRPGGTGVVTVSRGRAASANMNSNGGAFGRILPQHLGDGEGIEVTYREPAGVALLNATRLKGLATATGQLLPGVELIANSIDQQRKTSTVYFAKADARHDAEEVARRLRIAEVRPAPLEVVALGNGARVIVVLGNDRLPG